MVATRDEQTAFQIPEIASEFRIPFIETIDATLQNVTIWSTELETYAAEVLSSCILSGKRTIDAAENSNLIGWTRNQRCYNLIFCPFSNPRALGS